ncbi:phage shock protein PspC (stress-responsive transcriptional regulator) [Variovorax sp. Sphag1AA]|nr:phage shock protein PspC (stress-responsive transcriptional regulator) [Variovorax sp. Sphag1AA]
MKSIPWIACGFFLFGMAAYLFLSWFLNSSSFEHYSNLVYAAGVIGGLAGMFLSRRVSNAAKPGPRSGDGT